MEQDDVREQSEECLLDRHGDCSGEVLLTSSSNVKIRTRCRCVCHGDGP